MALDDLPWEMRLERLKDLNQSRDLGDNNPHIFVRIFNDRFDKCTPWKIP